jgi:hypothetical protein
MRPAPLSDPRSTRYPPRFSSAPELFLRLFVRDPCFPFDQRFRNLFKVNHCGLPNSYLFGIDSIESIHHCFIMGPIAELCFPFMIWNASNRLSRKRYLQIGTQPLQQFCIFLSDRATFLFALDFRSPFRFSGYKYFLNP